MTPRAIVLRSLGYFWRTNLAVVAGVAVAVSVLAGALLVGESVRASLRGLVDERLGRTAIAITGQGFFRQALAQDMKAAETFSRTFADAATIVALEGSITHEPSGREASRVAVYGIDASFLALHGVTGVEVPTGRQALLSPGLAAELGTSVDDGLLLRVQKPSRSSGAVPIHPARSASRPARRWRPTAWASSRCARSRTPCERCSCPSRACREISICPAAPMCCSSRARRMRHRPRATPSAF
jgi:hypothetical protein